MELSELILRILVGGGHPGINRGTHREPFEVGGSRRMPGSLTNKTNCIDTQPNCQYNNFALSDRFDPATEAKNLARHQISLTRGRDLSIERVRFSPRHGEDRWIGFEDLDGVLHAVVWTTRDGDRWLISLRRASRRERKEHARHA